MSRAPKSWPSPTSSVTAQASSSEERSPDEQLTVVAVCGGHRCQALLGLRDDGGLERLRHAVRNSSRSVLVTAQCLQRCADGPVILVGEGGTEQGRLQVVPRQLIAPASAEQLHAVASALGVEE